MTRQNLVILGGGILGLSLAAHLSLAQRGPVPRPKEAAQAPAAASQAAGLMPLESQTALVKEYCSGCHNERIKSGGMTLTNLDLAHLDQNPVLAEKVIRKVKTGLMPPSTAAKRPDLETRKAFVTALEAQMDKLAALHPNPGSRPFQRLTRTEYARSIRDLLGIDEDVESLLPPDSLSDGLDNISDSQPFSPALLEGYIRAAAKISRDALGDPKADATSVVYKLPRTASQLRHVDGAPFGTRGGISIVYNFPADGDYTFRSLLHGTPTGQLFGWVPNEQLEVSIDGERVALLNVDPRMSESSPTGLNLTTGHFPVKAGAHRVSAAFLEKHSELIDDDIAPIDHTLADTEIGDYGETVQYPHLREFEIGGPFNVSGVSDTPSRRKVFICRPLNPAEEIPCATKIISEIARKAYRRPVSPEDLEGLMTFYQRGRKDGDFESGIRMGLQAILASPIFVFRIEPAPANVRAGQNYRVGDLELASRLSFFLWSTLPDDELVNLASQGRLKDPVVLEKQVRRMLNDPRSESLATKFAGQWLHLPDLENLHPDAFYYPFYDHTLALGLKRETELFFDSIVREDRNILDLLTGSHTFVNERVAKHYGIPNVRGNEFRRVEVTDDYRKGLLGKGAILALTSVADRTSPVLRGKWVMGVLLGVPPPPPPPAVPKLDETSPVSDGRSLTVRERMEVHRANPACNSCHQMIDPIGLALENFDVTGAWRTVDKTAAVNSEGIRVSSPGVPIDTTTKMYDGTPLNGPASLRAGIFNHSDAFIENLTAKLLEYAIGRRVEYYDMPLVRSIGREAAKNNNRFSSYILGIVKSAPFQMSRAESN
jgi:hypothetical protein